LALFSDPPLQRVAQPCHQPETQKLPTGATSNGLDDASPTGC
jgi:hypothetical protein